MPATEKKSQYEYSYKKDYQEDWDVHRKYISAFDPLEAMLIGQVYDSVSNSIDGSKITDSYTATLAIERAARVMGKLPDGMSEAMGKADQGKAAFMDILRQKWIYPNADSQYPFETKMEMTQLYSDVYGYFPVFYDWNVNPNGYVGPDCWLWSPRNLVFQQGRNFFKDMEYVTALTWVSVKFIDEVLEHEDDEDGAAAGWNYDALRELRDLAAQETADPDAEKDTRVERNRQPQGVKKGICLATRYEAGPDGEWCTFAPDHAYVEVRKLLNPHKNNRIPFRIKYSQELYDSVYGLGDFARSKPLQFARDGLTNFYFKGIKMNLIPPIVVNANGVLKHTVDYREGSVMMETIPNSIRRLETSNAGLATYQAAQSNLTGSLLSLWGSQSASLPGAETLNPSQGKTPAAIDLYQGKEDTRDGRARKRLEMLIEELTDAFFSLIVNIGTETIPVNLFAKDIEEIDRSGLGDVNELFKEFTPNTTFTGGQLTIDPKKLKDIEFRFHITPGSTAAINKKEQLAEVQNLMGDIAKFQNQFKDDPSIEVNWAQILKVREALTNVPGVAQFVTIKTPEQVQQAQEAAAKAAAAANQQPQKSPAESLNYKDAPEDIKRQIEQQAGMQPSAMMSPAATQQALDHSKIIETEAKTQLATQDHALKFGQAAATATHNDNQHQLATQQAATQAEQASDTHNLAVASAASGENQSNQDREVKKKEAAKPKPKAK
jgi:hypothetical protein